MNISFLFTRTFHFYLQVAFVRLARNSYLLSKIKFKKSISYFQLVFQLFEESSNNRPKIFPHVPTHCGTSPVSPSPTLALAASNEQRPFLSCFLAAHMLNSNCSPGMRKSQLPIQNPKRDILCVHVYFIYRTGSYKTSITFIQQMQYSTQERIQ